MWKMVELLGSKNVLGKSMICMYVLRPHSRVTGNFVASSWFPRPKKPVSLYKFS